ncbi:hypothetical protein Q5P01_016125 [Channa striata]|uniref:DUF4590 domain-containing protein n=1 Tax=Channa striata TaxID=64152 RepID=A0AA88MFP7_CHASR|nr:hypothetical protein Q5P01_016125 [Channa striata]
MSNLNPGLISAYNSLSDKHLAGYFSNTRIRRHLQRAGLITRSGRIVPDKEYRHRLIQRAQQRHVRECLAQAIFHKVLEMERLHQIEIRRKLEEFARRERVYRIKVERSKRCEEDIVHILSPRPPTGTRGIQKQHSGPEGEHSESSESPGSSRPNTAPGKMQRPVRLKPIHSNSAMASLRRSSPYRRHESAKENDQLFPCTMDKDSRRRLTTLEASHGVSPYCLPVINNFVTPVPPATKRKERAGKVTASGTIRGRRLRPTTASSGADASEDPPMLRSSVHQSRVCVNMVYFGKSVHLSHDLTEMRDEVKVFQQHCGGENLCVYKGRLREGDTFQFISRRHRGFPFSLTFFLNGLQVERLSSCCEFKHRKGSRLGGRHGHFGFSSVEGASPCYRCIIAMGLDKKPIPPPNRVKEDERVGHKREELVTSPKDTSAYSDCETSQQQDMETQIKEETAAEDKVRNDYEEDFEADDEGPTEDCEAKEKTPASPSSEAERQVRETDASDTEDNEKGEKMQSRSGSSSLGSTQEESDGDAEVPKDSRDEETAEQPEKVTQEETVAGPDENDKPNPEEASKESDLQDSAGDSTEIDISDTSFPSGSENRQMEDTLGGREAEKMVDKDKQEEEQERAKSVQEKLAEAIFKESQCSSEPELSDTSTEEDEEATDKSHKQDNNDAVSEQEQALEEETKSEECVTSEDEGVQEQEETSGPNEKSESEKETTGTDADNEDSASQVEKAENDQSVVTGAGGAEEKMPDDNTISETQEDDEFKSPDADAAQEADENEEKPAEAEEADVQLDQMGQGAKSSEEDESSLSDMNKETDETAVVDNAEAEAAMTMEMKAEPSEEQEALSCEEALVTDTDEGQQEDSKDTAAASENSSSSSQESADTMVEKTADISEDNGKDEGGTDDVKEEEATKDSAVEDDEKEMCEVGEELTGKSIEITDEAEKDTCEEESTDKLTQNNPGEIVEAENTEEKEIDERKKEENEESNTEERIEHEDITEGRRSDSDTEGQTNKETAEETLGEEDTAANDEKAAESEKDADDESARNKLDEEETEAQEAATDETNDGEGTNDSKTTADEERGDKAGKEEKDEIERKAEQFESVKNGDDESKENEIISDENGQEEDILGTTEEPDKGADEDICDNETAEGTKTTEEPLNNTMESEDAEKETEEADNNGENGGIDAENREVSTVTDNETHEDEAEAPNYNDLTTTEEPKIEEPTEDKSPGVNAATVESGDEAEEREDEEVDQVSETNVAQSEAKEEDVDVENQDNLEQETADTEGKQESNPDDLKGDREDDADLNETAQSTAMSEPQPDNQQHAGANFSAADEEHRGDEEEASKASKEGEGVLHKPPSQKEDDIVKGKVSPEVLAREDNTDLVTNWVTMHQTAKYFETFVEPLEDLREESSGKEAVQSTELLAAESPLKVGEMPENDEKDSGESEIKSNHAEDEAKETPQEETKVNDFRPNPETEENDKASSNGQEVKSEPKGSRGSTEEEQTNNGLTRTEEESMADTHQSAASVRAESVTEQTADNDQGHSASPSGPKDTEETRGKTDEPSREVTEITDFITSKSDDGSQVESLQGEIQPKPSDGSIGGDGGDAQLIKDRLSSLSMDETLFGRSSYTMLSSALTESGH